MVSFQNAALERTFAGVCCSTPAGISTSPYSILFHVQVAPDVIIHFSRNLTDFTHAAQFRSHRHFDSASKVSSGSLKEEEMTLVTSCRLQILSQKARIVSSDRGGFYKRRLLYQGNQMKKLLLLHCGGCRILTKHKK